MIWLGDWNFLNWWWWRPIIEPIVGLLWLAFFILVGVLIYAFVGSRSKISDYRVSSLDPGEMEIPAEESEIARYLETHYPDVSEDEILEMEDILETVLREDIHEEMAREIERRGIPVRLIDLPTPDLVKDVGGLPLAVWIPSLEAIEIFASPMKKHCGGDPAHYREYMGNLLLHEMGHALGLGESKIKDFGV